MKRRELLGAIAGTLSAWPVIARAQKQELPVIGVLDNSGGVADFSKGLGEGGLAEGRDVVIETRSTRHFSELKTFAAELVRRNVTVLAALGGVPTHEARQATSTIPIVFAVGGDPVELGLVANLSRPGGNLTGATFFAAQLLQKQIGMLRDLVPGATSIGVLVNPENPRLQADVQDVQTAARVLGLRVHIAEAGNERKLDEAFAGFGDRKVEIGIIAGDAFFFVQRARIVGLASRYGIPMMYNLRAYVQSGGLMSYGASFSDAYRQAGLYAARIVKGERPGDLPVVQPTKFDFSINIKTARALGIAVPPTLLATADEVIE